MRRERMRRAPSESDKTPGNREESAEGGAGTGSCRWGSPSRGPSTSAGSARYGAGTWEDTGSVRGQGRGHWTVRSRGPGTPRCEGCLGPRAWEMARSGRRRHGLRSGWVGCLAGGGGGQDGQGIRVRVWCRGPEWGGGQGIWVRVRAASAVESAARGAGRRFAVWVGGGLGVKGHARVRRGPRRGPGLEGGEEADGQGSRSGPPRPYPPSRSRRSERCRSPPPAAAPAAASCCARGRPWPARWAQRGSALPPPCRRPPIALHWRRQVERDSVPAPPARPRRRQPRPSGPPAPPLRPAGPPAPPRRPSGPAPPARRPAGPAPGACGPPSSQRSAPGRSPPRGEGPECRTGGPSRWPRSKNRPADCQLRDVDIPVSLSGLGFPFSGPLGKLDRL